MLFLDGLFPICSRTCSRFLTVRIDVSLEAGELNGVSVLKEEFRL